MKSKAISGWKSVVLLMAMAIAACLTTVDVKAASAPVDAKQTASQEDGVKVSWSAVPGAKSYVYSFSTDGTNYTQESPTGNGGVDTYVTVVNATLLKPGTDYYIKVRAFDGASYSEAVVVRTATAPAIPTSIKQIDAEPNSLTVNWEKSAGATGYVVRFGTSEATAKDYATVKNTTCKLTGLTPDTQYYLAVFPVRKVSSSFSASYSAIVCYKLITTAPAVKDLKLTEWDVRTNQIELSWSNTAKYEGGYQCEVYSADGTKLLKTYSVAGRRAKKTYFKNKKLKNTPFQYRMRTYSTINGQKFYGAWSDMKVAVPQGILKAEKKSDTSIKLSWDKIAGARTYTIGIATKDGGKFKTLKTLKKTSFVVTNLDANKDYYFYVKANKVAVGGKTYSSTKVETTNDINVFITKYSDTVTE